MEATGRAQYRGTCDITIRNGVEKTAIEKTNQQEEQRKGKKTKTTKLEWHALQ